MNAVKKTACALAVLATTSTAVMAQSIDVKVIGTITPAACKPTLAGGGTINYGNIPGSSLKEDGFTPLDVKQLDFAITCDAPTKIALKAINGRPNTAAGSEGDGPGSASRWPDSMGAGISDYVVGLGLDGGKKVGGYAIAITDVRTDDRQVGYKFTRPDESYPTWYENSSGSVYDAAFPILTSWSLPNVDATSPVPFITLAGKLKVQAYINKTSELDLSKPIKLDGLTTLELVYL